MILCYIVSSPIKHYRGRSSVLERVEIAKVCLMMDMNLTKKFINKNIEDIQFSVETIISKEIYCRSQIKQSHKSGSICIDLVSVMYKV